jgi:cell division control protein 12
MMTDILSTADDLPPPPPPPATSVGTGIANLPNQRHKIVAKNGANFTIMVCGKLLDDQR